MGEKGESERTSQKVKKRCTTRGGRRRREEVVVRTGWWFGHFLDRPSGGREKLRKKLSNNRGILSPGFSFGCNSVFARVQVPLAVFFEFLVSFLDCATLF
jgi:hypothetical protein